MMSDCCCTMKKTPPQNQPSAARKMSLTRMLSLISDIFVVTGGSVLLLAIGVAVIAGFLYVLKSLLGINLIADFSVSGMLLGK